MHATTTVCAALLALVGIGQSPSPPPRDARCVFYRESALTGKALHASIRIDGGTATHKLPSGRIWETAIAPGDHLIYSDEERYGRTYQLQGGQVYYFRVEFRTNPPAAFGKLRFQIVPVESPIATNEMSVLKPDKP